MIDYGTQCNIETMEASYVLHGVDENLSEERKASLDKMVADKKDRKLKMDLEIKEERKNEILQKLSKVIREIALLPCDKGIEEDDCFGPGELLQSDVLKAAEDACQKAEEEFRRTLVGTHLPSNLSYDSPTLDEWAKAITLRKVVEAAVVYNLPSFDEVFPEDSTFGKLVEAYLGDMEAT